MIIKNYDLSELKHKRDPLWWHKQGLRFTASGYGRRIPTEIKIQLPGSNRWRRVYCCIYSNAGTCYVVHGKNWIVVSGSASC